MRYLVMHPACCQRGSQTIMYATGVFWKRHSPILWHSFPGALPESDCFNEAECQAQYRRTRTSRFTGGDPENHPARVDNPAEKKPMTTMTGSCLCGGVKYTCNATPVITGNCHCRDCQRSSGSAYAPTLFVPVEALSIHGEVRYFQSIGGSGFKVDRGFCPNCGSPLFAKVEVMPGLISIRAGTLDDPSAYVPSADLFVSQAAPWDHIPDGAMKFDGMPPQSACRPD
ncbi:GFA family protein [Uliginosibacterium sp. 31-16]|uniref:GFA family protein n=1 Tax=Uliginosibacterium sp. 31-16 TaxID=3068315 RepID=UPI00273F2742|nr:GFA family protein [Uliginosibacterium sp. 31-16]MDP5238715.1 GFA family protein [Uliginosibacterium sp. 31-16]